MLTSVLRQGGHEVVVVDYQYQPKAPSINKFLMDFDPEIVGVSMYTASVKEAYEIISAVKNFKENLPILLGGPHTSFFAKDLVEEKKGDYIFIGEAEEEVAHMVESAKREKEPRVIQCKPPDVKKLPLADFTSFYKFGNITTYPLMTSRGCPHKCSFCTVGAITSRRWRWREPESCVEELELAVNILSNTHTVFIVDDNPTVKLERMKRFVDLYIEHDFPFELCITNIRADSIDRELLELLKRAGCQSIVVAVEHGHPEVFNAIDKHETLNDIKKAAEMVKAHGFHLGLTFIIGLPLDSLSRTRSSINLAKQLKPDGSVYWNMLTPFAGTKVYEWYKEHGELKSPINHTSLCDGDFMPEEPVVQYPGFTAEEQKKAYLMAIMQTNNYVLRVRHLPRLLPQVVKHHLYSEFFQWLGNKFAELVKLPRKVFSRLGFKTS